MRHSRKATIARAPGLSAVGFRAVGLGAGGLRAIMRSAVGLATAVLVTLALAVLVALNAARAQTPWTSDVELRRTIPPAGAPAGPTTGWGTSASPATRPPALRPSTGAPAPPAARPELPRTAIALTAHLTQDGEPIDQGLVWRVFTEPARDAEGKLGQPALVATSREPTPVVPLPTGAYVVNVTYGRAHLTRRIAVGEAPRAEERFVLNAGGLRVTCALAGGEKPADSAVAFDVYQGDADQLGGRTRLMAAVRPGIIVRLNAGLYHIVSTVGDANATVAADVTVEAGKLTDAVLTHHAARVTLKLVTRNGGEAQADTQWSVHTLQGDLVRESQDALPTHILAAGPYIASARHSGRLYQRQFTVQAGEPAHVEVAMH